MIDDLEIFGPVRERIPLLDAEGIALLLMVDGRALLAHDCDRTPSNPHRAARFTADGGIHRIAPRLVLEGGHVILSERPATVRPSVLCEDCGLHGFITEGRWASA